MGSCVEPFSKPKALMAVRVANAVQRLTKFDLRPRFPFPEFRRITACINLLTFVDANGRADSAGGRGG